MNRTLAGAIALVCFAAAGAAAQTCPRALVGRVTDQMGNPIRGALVSASEPLVHVAADSNGRYRLCGLPAGPTTVSARFLGMTPYLGRVLISGDRDDTLDLHLGRPGLCRHASTLDTALLAAAEARWKSRGLRSYTFEATESYYGPGTQVPWVVTVRNDTVVDATEASKWKPSDSIPFGGTHVRRDVRHFDDLTPPRLFERLNRYLTDSIHSTSVQYDLTLGYPTVLSENLNCAYDAGGTIRIEHLRPRGK